MWEEAIDLIDYPSSSPSSLTFLPKHAIPFGLRITYSHITPFTHLKNSFPHTPNAITNPLLLSIIHPVSTYNRPARPRKIATAPLTGAATKPAAPVEEALAADWLPEAVAATPPVVAVTRVFAPEAPEAVVAVVEAWGMVAAAAALEDRRLECVLAEPLCYVLRGGDALRSSGGTVGGDLVLNAGFLGEARAVVVAAVEKKVLVRAEAVLVKFPRGCWDGQIRTSTGSGTAGRGRSNQCQSRH